MATDLHGPVSARPYDTAVRVEGLTRSFDGRAVVDGLDLTLRAGEFTALLGAAAAGSRLCYGCWPGSTAISRARYWCPSDGLLPSRRLG